MHSESRSATERRLALLGYLAYGLLGWTTYLLPSLITEIQGSFDRSDADFGIVFFLSALLYGLGGLGGGFLIERIGPRHVLAGAFLLLGASLFGGALVGVWVLFVAVVTIGKLANGSLEAGFGALFLTTFSDRRAQSLSSLHLSYAIGALAAPSAIGLGVSAGIDWQIVFGIGGFVSWAGLLVLWRLNWGAIPEGTRTSTGTDRNQGGIMGLPFLFLATTMVLFGAQVSGITSWIVRYLEDDGIGIATLALSAFWVGVCISRFLGRWLATTARPTTLCPIMLAAATVFLLAAVLSSSSTLTVCLLVAAGFFTGPVFPLLIAIGGDLFPDHLGRMTGGMTVAATIGALTYPPLIGVISTHYSLRAGLIGAAVLGFPAILALALAFRSHEKSAVAKSAQA